MRRPSTMIAIAIAALLLILLIGIAYCRPQSTPPSLPEAASDSVATSPKPAQKASQIQAPSHPAAAAKKPPASQSPPTPAPAPVINRPVINKELRPQSAEQNSAQETSPTTEPVEPSEPEHSAKRPQNALLAPPSWMAQPTDIDLDELEAELLDGEMRQEFLLSLKEDRHRALHLARQTLAHCPPILDERARFAIEFTLRTEAGTGFIIAPREFSSIYIEDPTLLGCILDQLTDLQFDATGDGADLTVHWVYP